MSARMPKVDEAAPPEAVTSVPRPNPAIRPLTSVTTEYSANAVPSDAARAIIRCWMAALTVVLYPLAIAWTLDRLSAAELADPAALLSDVAAFDADVLAFAADVAAFTFEVLAAAAD